MLVCVQLFRLTLTLMSCCLQSLGMDRNRFRGTLPSSWSRLVRLKSLYLSDNQLYGTIPVRVLLEAASATMGLKCCLLALIYKGPMS